MSSLLPIIGYGDAKTKHGGSEAWKNFASRITRNPFVNEYLRNRDGALCQRCKRHLQDDVVIHHKDYDHICSFNKTVRFEHPTERRPNRTNLTPDCESCSMQKNENFMSCMQRLVLVHSGCNRRLASDAINARPIVQTELKHKTCDHYTSEVNNQNKHLKYLSHGVYLQIFLGIGLIPLALLDVPLPEFMTRLTTWAMMLIALGLNSLAYINRYKASTERGS